MTRARRKIFSSTWDKEQSAISAQRSVSGKEPNTPATKGFAPTVLAQFEKTKYLYIRSGNHRHIPIWVVVVAGRVVVRSWNDKPSGWYRAFLADPLGHIRFDEHEVPVRAVPVRSARLNDGADDAFALKYTTKANAKYVKGFKTPKRKAATLELIPA